MLKYKGQVSLIDVLMLSVIISIVLVAGNYFTSRAEISSQQVREESVYSQGMLITGLNYRFDLNGYNNLSSADYISLHFCNYPLDEPSKKTLEEKLNETFDKIVKKDYNYIFFSRIDKYDSINITAYNHQSTVCGQYIPLTSIKGNFTCPNGKKITVEFFLGIWPKWKNYPENC